MTAGPGTGQSARGDGHRAQRRGDARYAVHPLAAHRTVGGEIFVVTDDRAFHRISTPTAVDLFKALGTAGARRDDLVALLVGRYRVQAEQAGADVDEFLASLVGKRVAVRLDAAPDETQDPVT